MNIFPPAVSKVLSFPFRFFRSVLTSSPYLSEKRHSQIPVQKRFRSKSLNGSPESKTYMISSSAPASRFSSEISIQNSRRTFPRICRLFKHKKSAENIRALSLSVFPGQLSVCPILPYHKRQTTAICSFMQGFFFLHTRKLQQLPVSCIPTVSVSI